MMILWTREKDRLVVKLVQEDEEVTIGLKDHFAMVADHHHPGTYLRAFNLIRCVKVERRQDDKINEDVTKIIERIFFEEQEKVKGKKTIRFLWEETMTSGDFYVVGKNSGGTIIWTPERRGKYWLLNRTQHGCLLFMDLREIKTKPIHFNFEKGQFE